MSIHLKVVERKEGLRLSSLLLDVLNTVSASLLGVNNDGIHVLSQHFGHSDLILLLSGLTQVDQTAILETEQHIFLVPNPKKERKKKGFVSTGS